MSFIGKVELLIIRFFFLVLNDDLTRTILNILVFQWLFIRVYVAYKKGDTSRPIAIGVLGFMWPVFGFIGNFAILGTKLHQFELRKYTIKFEDSKGEQSTDDDDKKDGL